MNLPTLRKHPYIHIEGKNYSFTELRGSVYPGIEVLSVRAVEYGTHNTELIVRVDQKQMGVKDVKFVERYIKRNCLYNRLNLRDIIPWGLTLELVTLEKALIFFKTHGFDFTNDDIEIRNGNLYAKETSLGYYGNAIGNDVYLGDRLLKESLDGYILTDQDQRINIKEEQ